MADTVKFPANLPVELALKFDTGLECQSQFNNQDQVCYTLADDRQDVCESRSGAHACCQWDCQIGM